MACCAMPGGCGRVAQMSGGTGMVRRKQDGLFYCRLCYVLPALFPPIVRCPTMLVVNVSGRQDQCRLVEGHPGACEPPRNGRSEGNPARDGEYDIAANKSHDPTYEPRRRVGPHR
jgi:hypothetical protein